jgi:hypothetical protein
MRAPAWQQGPSARWLAGPSRRTLDGSDRTDEPNRFSSLAMDARRCFGRRDARPLAHRLHGRNGRPDAAQPVLPDGRCAVLRPWPRLQAGPRGGRHAGTESRRDLGAARRLLIARAADRRAANRSFALNAVPHHRHTSFPPSPSESRRATTRHRCSPRARSARFLPAIGPRGSTADRRHNGGTAPCVAGDSKTVSGPRAPDPRGNSSA